MRNFFRRFLFSIKSRLGKLSFATGVWVLLLCIPFYIVSFAQMALPISYTLKGTLWIIFFGLAKTFQYCGLAILGAEGVKRIKKWWHKTREKKISASGNSN